MQRTNFSYITDGIAKVIETEERLLKRLVCRSGNTKNKQAKSYHQADTRSFD